MVVGGGSHSRPVAGRGVLLPLALSGWGVATWAQSRGGRGGVVEGGPGRRRWRSGPWAADDGGVRGEGDMGVAAGGSSSSRGRGASSLRL